MNGRFSYVIDRENRVCEVSDEWLEFATANRADPLGSSDVMGSILWDWIQDDETRQLYECLIEKVRSTGNALTVPFRCDGPKVRRFMELQIRKGPNDKIELISELVREEDRPHQGLLDPASARSGEFLRMCSWCKTVPVSEGDWVEVEAAVRRLDLFDARELPKISHTICPACQTKLLGDVPGVPQPS